jgi:hypothetical protein
MQPTQSQAEAASGGVLPAKALSQIKAYVICQQASRAPF